MYRKLIDKSVDSAFISKSPIGLQDIVVILDGAFCAGETAVMSRIRRRHTGCMYLEADQFKYWKREKTETDHAILEISL